MLILLIETLQFFGGRCWDIDDVIMNLLGMSLGYPYITFTQNRKMDRDDPTTLTMRIRKSGR
ncbi:MAG TPA: VanZ family protein [Candidatus Pullilachnospira gallistercoris]|uniref:VanZ family protein n=1 Tax=Candidatus Pullilachnospira gallistercoris TaxID=2840911 RepID=A0A9D1JAZ6_9FIRM|nr:VanZ family protein [Candidatus Pullilachnospira gallistercoris]